MIVSFVIVNYNTYNYTIKCLESIYEHSQGFKYEVVLVDNASTEKAPEDFLKAFPGIILVRNSENLGYSGGVNAGLRVAKGKFLVILNSDIELVENTVKICIDRLDKEKQTGVVSPKLTYENGKVQHICGSFPSIISEIYELLRLQRFMPRKLNDKVLSGFYFRHDTELYPDWLWGAFFILKREVLEKLPGKRMPESFFLYYEDVEWCYEIRKLGYDILYYPASRANHHLSISSGFQKDGMRKLKFTMPNEFRFVSDCKGHLYAQLFCLFKALKFLSLRKRHFRQIAKLYFNFFLRKS